MDSDRLAAAADQLEIMAILTQYCHSLDRRDFDLLAACFHPDSTHEHGSFKGLSQDFLGFAASFLQGMGPTHHHLSAPLIRLSGDVAHTECYFLAYHRIPEVTPFPEPFAGTGVLQDLVIGGRYVDRFEKRHGAWKIANRIGVHDWQRLSPAADAGFYDLPAEQRGAFGPADPAWSLRRGV
jgi:hypothetical protein